MQSIQMNEMRERDFGTKVSLADQMPAGGLYAWLLSMSGESLGRLKVINANTSSSKHVILALAFGLYDGNIRRLNRMITQLLLARMRAERHGDACKIARINELMEEMHVAIDKVTGVDGRGMRQDQDVCNRPRGASRKSPTPET